MSEPTTPSRPRVVMVVANEITPDTRVKKMAVTLQRAGLEVLVVGYTRYGRRTEADMEGVTLIRVPVKSTFRKLQREEHLSSGVTGIVRSVAQRLRDRYSRDRAYLERDNREHQAIVRHLKEEMERKGREEQELLRRAVEQRAADGPADRVRRYLLHRRMRMRRRLRTLPESRELRRRRADIERRRRTLDRTYRRYGRLRDRSDALARRKLTRQHGGWRTVLPELHDFEAAFGPVLDELEPDIIHAHDMHVIGIGARAAARARGAGRDTKLVYDAHEYVAGLTRHMEPYRQQAFLDLEREYVHWADAVVTVSDELAVRLEKDYDLPQQPAVVLNTPMLAGQTATSEGLREKIGLAAEVPLLVYSGRVHSSRDVGTLVEALRWLPSVHLALVCGRETAYVEQLRDRAREAGTVDRLHVLPYVDPYEVVSHLRSATAGVNLLVPCANHEVALPNKLWEYLHAGLPILNSEVGTSAEFVTNRGVGETFRPEDPEDLAAAARRLLDRLPDLRRRIAEDPDLPFEFSWENQEKRLVALYTDLTARELEPGARIESLTERRVPLHASIHAESKIVIGPLNRHGRASVWAAAIHEHFPGVEAEVHGVEGPGPDGGIAPAVKAPGSGAPLSWQVRQLQRILLGFSHALLEGGTGLSQGLVGRDVTGELSIFAVNGLRVGIVLDADDVRDPEIHAELEEHSPYAAPGQGSNSAAELRRRLQEHHGPTYVSSLELLDYVEDAHWLPEAVDPEVWDLTPRRLEGPLRVLHVNDPTGHRGTAYVVESCRRLAADGLLEFAVVGPQSPRFRSRLEHADVLIDGLTTGDYTVDACRAMAARRLVVGHVAKRVRSRLDGGGVPILEASPDNLEDVLRDIVAAPERYEGLAGAGPEFIRRHHSTQAVAAALDELLGPPWA